MRTKQFICIWFTSNSILDSTYQKELAPAPTTADEERLDIFFSLLLQRIYEIDDSANNFKAKWSEFSHTI